MYRVAPEDSLKAADFPSGGSEGFKAFGVRRRRFRLKAM
jgi:hypothetical protein